jgi:hypothetical protein
VNARLTLEDPTPKKDLSRGLVGARCDRSPEKQLMGKRADRIDPGRVDPEGRESFGSRYDGVDGLPLVQPIELPESQADAYPGHAQHENRGEPSADAIHVVDAPLAIWSRPAPMDPKNRERAKDSPGALASSLLEITRAS